METKLTYMYQLETVQDNIECGVRLDALDRLDALEGFKKDNEIGLRIKIS